jgi:hypothetical protein
MNKNFEICDDLLIITIENNQPNQETIEFVDELNKRVKNKVHSLLFLDGVDLFGVDHTRPIAQIAKSSGMLKSISYNTKNKNLIFKFKLWENEKGNLVKELSKILKMQLKTQMLSDNDKFEFVHFILGTEK